MFGEPSRLQQMTGNRQWAGGTGYVTGTTELHLVESLIYFALIGKQTSKEKSTIKVITSDLIREIR